jgi:hypothetical protein
VKLHGEHALPAGSQGVAFVFNYIGVHSVFTYSVGTRCFFPSCLCGQSMKLISTCV